MKQLVKKTVVESYLNLRSLAYTLESLPLPYMNRIIAGAKTTKPTRAQNKQALSDVQKLIKEDSKDFAAGLYPVQMYRNTSLREHLPSLAKVLGDSTLSAWRRRNKKTKEFSHKADNPKDFPEYYQRNFHHQTDGYLSEESAELYDHQVELLFRGTASLMRRRLIKPIHKKIKDKKNIKILEVASGTGTLTRMLALAFPDAQITAVELSPSYVGFSKKRLSEFKNVSILQGNAEELDFNDGSFDVVVSTYLHHELPYGVRKKVIAETIRLTANDGFWGLLDSCQLGDNKHMDWALKEFPKNFHEPFYKNYISKPIRDIIKEIKPKAKTHEEVHFLSKLIYLD